MVWVVLEHPVVVVMRVVWMVVVVTI